MARDGYERLWLEGIKMFMFNCIHGNAVPDVCFLVGATLTLETYSICIVLLCFLICVRIAVAVSSNSLVEVIFIDFSLFASLLVASSDDCLVNFKFLKDIFLSPSIDDLKLSPLSFLWT